MGPEGPQDIEMGSLYVGVRITSLCPERCGGGRQGTLSSFGVFGPSPDGCTPPRDAVTTGVVGESLDGNVRGRLPPRPLLPGGSDSVRWWRPDTLRPVPRS